MAQAQSVVSRSSIEFDGAEMVAADLEARHQNSPGGNQRGAAADGGMLATGVDEDQDVSGQHDGVEVSTRQLELGEIGLVPLEPWSFGARALEHRWIEVYADRSETPPLQFDGHPAGTAPSIEHPWPRGDVGDEGGLPVYIGARGR